MKIQANKLMYGKELVGYRFIIMDNHGFKSISLDVAKKDVKAFLSLVDQSKMIKGFQIKGNVVKGMFVTFDEENVVEVTSMDEAADILKRYDCFNDVEDVLGGINSTEDEERAEYLNEIFDGHIATLENCFSKNDEKVVITYNRVVKALKGIKGNLDIQEDDDEYEATVIFRAFLPSIEALVNYIFNYHRLVGEKELKCKDVIIRSKKELNQYIIKNNLSCTVGIFLVYTQEEGVYIAECDVITRGYKAR